MSSFARSCSGCVVIVACLIAGQSCAGVTYQDARLVGKGKMEITPTVTRMGFSEGGDSETIGTAYGGMVTVGISDKADFITGYQRFKPRGFDGGSNFAGAGPKFSLVRNRLAFLVPVTFAFGDGVDVGESLQFSPTAVASLPIGDRVTFNPGVKVVVSSCEGCDVLVGGQAGLSIRLGERAVLRPEAGVLFNPGESGFTWTFGMGLSLRPR